MPVVSVERCPIYDSAALAEALEAALAPFGGIGAFVKPGARVLLKINHLGRYAPETAVDTHPEFLRAVIEIVRPITPNVTVADGLWNPGLDDYSVSGILQVARDTGVELVNLTGRGYRDIRRDTFEAAKAFPFSTDALDADVVINLPKLKTHALCIMTCAIKNCYGFLPRKLKVNYHVEFGDPNAFGNMLVDVWSARPPELTLVDAVTAMEGSGPASDGKPVDLGLVVAGRDAVAVDAVVEAIMGLAPGSVPSTAHAARRGLGVADLTKIEIVGEPVAKVSRRFALPATATAVEIVSNRLPKPLLRMLARVLMTRKVYPRIVESRCTGCGLCIHHCPAEAVRLRERKARIDREKCIACFCCQEFCASAAVEAKPSGLGALLAMPFRLLRRLGGRRKNRAPAKRKSHG